MRSDRSGFRRRLNRPTMLVVGEDHPVDLKISAMSLTRCPYCKHGNPADARVCSACGGELHLPRHLAPCPHCGAVGPVKATVCYWCRGELPGRRLRRPSRAIVATAVLAAIAVLGYYIYVQGSLVDAPLAPEASSEASGREAPAGAGLIGRDAAAGDNQSAGADARLATPPSGTTAKPAATITRPQAIRGGQAGVQREQSRPEACTEAAAALGLCTTKPALIKEAGDARKEPPRPQTCTEATAALGLCTPTIQQRRE